MEGFFRIILPGGVPFFDYESLHCYAVAMLCYGHSPFIQNQIVSFCSVLLSFREKNRAFLVTEKRLSHAEKAEKGSYSANTEQ